MKIKFVEEVPERKGGGRGAGHWVAAAKELKKHPGKWAIVGKVKTLNNMGSAVGRLKTLGCEAVGRMRVIYARWPAGAKKAK